MITVFTPVYNRANIINKLYESLKQQTCLDFEWLLVNDGSSDNIDEVVESFIKEDILNIRYYSQENGGKHRAINKGVQLANGDLFFIVDSDDTLKVNALQLLNFYYQQVKDDDAFAGVSGYRCDTKGHSVYNFRVQKIYDCTSIEYAYKFNQIGGLAEAFKTNVLRQYPFPDYPGEKFCAESLVWNRIAQKYKLRIFPDDIYVWNYLSDGLTSGSIRNRMKSPTYAITIYSELTKYNIPLGRKIRAAINFWRFYFCGPQVSFDISVFYLIFKPIGYYLHNKDLKIFNGR